MSEARVLLSKYMSALDEQIKIEPDPSFRMLLVQMYDSVEHVAIRWDEESAQEFSGDELTPESEHEPLADWERELLMGGSSSGHVTHRTGWRAGL